MSERKQLVLLPLVLVALVVVLVAINRGGHHSSVPAATDRSHLVLVKSDSVCYELPGYAQVRFRFVVRNTGSTAGSADPIPWIRYSDGRVDNAFSKMLDIQVRAHASRRYVIPFDYNPARERLIGCGFKPDGGLHGAARIPVA